MSCAGVEGLIAGWCWQGGGGDVCLFTDVSCRSGRVHSGWCWQGGGGGVCLFTDVLCDTGVEGLKLATRQYARRQLKWIRNRFLKRKSTCRCEIRTQCFRELFSYCVTSWCRITVSLHPSHALLISQSCCVMFWGTHTVNVSVMHVLSRRWCCVMQSGCIQLLSFQFPGQSCYFQFSGQSCYFRFSGQSSYFSFWGDTLNNYMLFSGHVEWLYFTVSGWSLSHWSCF